MCASFHTWQLGEVTVSKGVCVVAGVGSGVGMAVARRFAREGVDVALLARDPLRSDNHARDVADLSGRADIQVIGEAVDLNDTVSLQHAMVRIIGALGTRTVLVYNAACRHQMPALQMTAAEFTAESGVNVVGALHCVQFIALGRFAAGNGRIIFSGGGLALHPQYGVGVSALSAGKSALRALGYALHGELSEAGIYVSMVTIAGTVATNTPFDADRIVEYYWNLYMQPRSE